MCWACTKKITFPFTKSYSRRLPIILESSWCLAVLSNFIKLKACRLDSGAAKVALTVQADKKDIVRKNLHVFQFVVISPPSTSTCFTQCFYQPHPFVISPPSFVSFPPIPLTRSCPLLFSTLFPSHKNNSLCVNSQQIIQLVCSLKLNFVVGLQSHWEWGAGKWQWL